MPPPCVIISQGLFVCTGDSMAKGKADISNFAARVFLQRIGAHYDTVRGYPEYRKQAHFKTVQEFFDNRCCYCGIELEGSSPNEDHLVPLNKTHMGLHCWGNVVPSCAKCNAKKQGKDWRDFLGECAADDYTQRANRIKAFQREYRYDPNSEELRESIESLYDEVGAIVMALIDTKIHRAEHFIDRIAAQKR